MGVCDEWRAQKSPYPSKWGGQLKWLLHRQLKKDMKVPGNYDSYLIFNLEQLFHCNLFVLGDPSGSVNASEAAAAAVLVEDDVIKLDLHEGGAGRQHLIMALGTNSPSEEGRGKSGLCSNKKQSYSCCVRPRSGTHWWRVRWHHMTQTYLLLWVYGSLSISCLALHTFPGLCMDVSAQAIVTVVPQLLDNAEHCVLLRL